jgi:SAM-dependent methyltransferase
MPQADEMTLYDRIGVDYAVNRRPDARWAAVIHRALGDATNILNVGAGTGSYEPDRRGVVALEPSRRMIAQRAAGAAPVVRGVAGVLPFADASFDAAVAILTVHHWPDAALGLAEMQRVARRQVVVSWEPELFAERFWLVREYLPAEADGLVTGRRIAEHLQDVETIPLPVPHDCTDGVFGAYWRRPEAYLDPSVRASISGLALLDAQVVEPAMARLAADLRSGAWRRRHADLLELSEIDLGYCVIVGTSRSAVT